MKKITSTKQSPISEGYMIYPNPTHGDIIITLEKDREYREIIISDLTGRKLRTIDGILAGDLELSLEGFNAGIYFMTLSTATSEKFISRIIIL